MKKRWIAWGLAALVLLALVILPSMVYRYRHDQKNQYYTASVDINRFALSLPKDELLPFLKKLRAAGVTNGVIREEAGGYPKAYLEAAEQAGLLPTLEPDVRNPSIHRLEELIETYHCRYIKLHVNLWSPLEETAEKRAEICRLIREKKCTLVLTETIEQLSNYHPEGFEEYLDAAEGRILRSSANGEWMFFEKEDYPSVYYHHFNAVLDRNIRYLIAAPLEDESLSAKENAERVADSMALLCKRLEQEGYSNEPAPQLEDYAPRRVLPSAAAAAMAVLMLAVMGELLFQKKKGLFIGSFIGAALLFLGTLLLPEQILLLYPTVFSSLAPCFSLVVCVSYMKRYCQKHSLWRLMGTGLLLAEGATLLGGCCLAGMINGWDYWLNELSFRGVKGTLIAPILFALCWMVAELWPKLQPSALKKTIGTLWQRRRWYHFLLLGVGLLLMALYIIRSGNVSSISLLETRMRDGLTDLLLARPRTKEFLFGWPFLMLFIYELSKKGSSSLLARIYLPVATILFASGINTFCHVFTPVEAMILRGIFGMILGLVIGGMVLILYRLFWRLITKK